MRHLDRHASAPFCRRVALLAIASGIGCKGPAKSAPASGAVGSSSAIATVAPGDAASLDAPTDAPLIATAIDRTCEAGTPIQCSVTPRGGTLPGRACWKAVVVIADRNAMRA